MSAELEKLMERWAYLEEKAEEGRYAKVAGKKCPICYCSLGEKIAGKKMRQVKISCGRNVKCQNEWGGRTWSRRKC